MRKWWEEMQTTVANDAEARKAAVKHYDKPWSQLKVVFKKGVKFYIEKVRRLEVGAGTQGSCHKRGQHGVRLNRFSSARGCRDTGGGRTDHLVQYKIMMKQWVETERSHGHSVDMTDLILQWCWYAGEVVKELEVKELEPHDRIFPSSIGTGWGKS